MEERTTRLVSTNFDIEYTENDTILKSYSGMDEVVYIPYGVTIINELAFAIACKTKKVIFPPTVRIIRRCAFFNMNNLEIVDMHRANIKIIPEFTFSMCWKLKTVKFSKHTTSLHDKSFNDCRALTYIKLPKTLEYIDNMAFAYCSSLKNIYLPNTIKYIGDSAFERCTSLNKVHLPCSNCARINSNTFRECESLKYINIPSNFKSISYYAFFKCTSLKRVTAKAILSIDDCAFSECMHLNKITVSATCKIGKFAFVDSFSGLKIIHNKIKKTKRRTK